MTWTGTIVSNTVGIITFGATIKESAINTVITNTSLASWWGAMTPLSATFDTFGRVYLPLVRRSCSGGICGRVTENGNPVSGIPLSLRYYNGSTWSTLASTTTASDGLYTFTGIPNLNAGQRYYVRYQNTAGTPGRLWFWGTREITVFLAGSTVEIGNFDIADIPLFWPSDGATVTLPYTFLWKLRAATSTDSYRVAIYDFNDGDPYAETNLVGYESSVTIASLPSPLSPNVPYGWDVRISGPDGGLGISYWTRAVWFSNTGMSVGTLSAPTVLSPQRLREHEIEERLKR